VDIVVDPAAFRAAIIGGALIGIAIALLLWLNGRVAGISGTLGGAVLDAPQGDRTWRFLFLGGLILGAFLVRTFSPAGMPVEMQTGWGGLVIAGLLVGVGTRMGNGCTSGHGLCGIARFSQRSILATITFMAAGIVTVFLLRHVGA
jgi:uncharacterized membrane protein YedE/YeeE